MDLPTGQIEIPVKEKKESSYFTRSKFVTELTPKDFDPANVYRLRRQHGCSFVMFYAPWCPHCKSLATPDGGNKGVWEQLGETAAFFDVCAFNCEKFKDHAEKIKAKKERIIDGFPSLVIYKNGEPVKYYEGERELKSLVETCLRACGIKHSIPDVIKRGKLE